MPGKRRLILVAGLVAALVSSCSSPSNPGPTGNDESSGPGTTGQPSSAGTPSPTAASQPVTLTYTGTITESRVGYSNPTEIGITRDLEMSWTMTYTGPILFDEAHPPPPSGRVWDSVQVSGNLLQISYDGFGNPHVQCAAKYSALPDRVAPPGIVTPSDTGDPTKVSVRVVAPAVFGLGAVATGDCEGEPDSYASPAFPPAAGVTELAPHVQWDLVSGGSQDFDRTLDFNDSGNPSAPDNNHLEIHSTVALSPADHDCLALLTGPTVKLAGYHASGPSAVAQGGAQICPIITWANPPNAAPKMVNDESPDVAIGQGVKLHADLSDGSDPTKHTIEWRIGGSAVAGFDTDGDRGSHGHVVPLPKPVSTRDVTVYWPQVESNPVMLLIDGHPASTTFVTHGPTATLNADVCGVGLDSPPGIPHGDLALPVFGPGLNAVCKDSGIAWHGNMSGDQPGTLGIIQLVLDSLKNEKGACAIPGAPEGYTGFAADQQTIYGGYKETIPHFYEDSDSPGLPLGGMRGTFTRLFVAQDYFVYKPNVGVDAIWVPVRRLLWRWTATAAGSGQTWTVTGSPSNSTTAHIDSTEWHQFPDWSWVTVNANAFSCTP